VLHDLVKILHHGGVPVAPRSQQQHVGADGKRHGSRDHGAVDVEEGQPAHGGFPLPDVRDRGGHHRHGGLVEVRVGGELGRPRGAARVIHGRAVFRGDDSARDESVAGVAWEHLIKAVDISFFVISSQDADHGLEIGQVVPDRFHLFPDVRARDLAQGHQDPGPCGKADVPDGGRFQEGVDGVGDARGLSAPEHVVGLGQVGKKIGDYITGTHTQVMKQVGRPGDVFEEFPVGHAQRILVILSGEDEAQGGRLRIDGSSMTDQVIGVLKGHAVLKGDPFIGFHIRQGRNIRLFHCLVPPSSALGRSPPPGPLQASSAPREELFRLPGIFHGSPAGRPVPPRYR